MPAPDQYTSQQTDSASSPAITYSWRFGDLPAAELLPYLQRHLRQQRSTALWQLVWLNNDERPVIGVLPKVSWSVYPTIQPSSGKSALTYSALTYKVIKTYREDCAKGHKTVTSHMSYREWQDELISYSKSHESVSHTTATHTIDPRKPDACHVDSGNWRTSHVPSRYHHGLMGFIGYDIAAHALSPADNIKLAAQPCAALGHYDICLQPSVHGVNEWALMVNETDDDASDNRSNERKSQLLTQLASYLDDLDQQLSTLNANHTEQPCADISTNVAMLKSTSHQPISLELQSLSLQPRWNNRDYRQAFNQTQTYLHLGDCYQINLTQEWSVCEPDTNNSSQPTPELIDYLPKLHSNTQAPFAGYLHIDGLDTANNETYQNHFELLSCSPELFFTFTKAHDTNAHHILTKPIKGTMPRGASDIEDAEYKQQLISSEKDRAENVMIVDLLRNDLGKYAKIGSVKVPQLFAIESFSNVHHMVSTITAELKTDTHPLAVLFGSLPAGSITGTPKKRAVEIISELEMRPRGAYCGTMGYMNFDGSGQWNVLIRTLQASDRSDDNVNTQKRISLWAGGGITVASDCEAEYQECLDKVGNLLAVLAQEV